MDKMLKFKSDGQGAVQRAVLYKDRSFLFPQIVLKLGMLTLKCECA